MKVNQEMEFLRHLETLLKDRKQKLPKNSYSSQLFSQGQDKILKKLIEESGEFLLAAKNHDKGEIIHEGADLFFHFLVALVDLDLSLSDIIEELELRKQ